LLIYAKAGFGRAMLVAKRMVFQKNPGFVVSTDASCTSPYYSETRQAMIKEANSVSHIIE
jgi:hypothetical protein